MHIGFITNEFPPGPHGGVGTFAHDLVTGLAALGHQVTVFVVEQQQKDFWSVSGGHLPDPEKPYRVCPVTVSAPAWMRWRGGELWKRWQVRRKVQAVHREQPLDIVESMDNWGCLPWGTGLPVPQVVRLHGATFFFDRRLGSNTGDPFTHQMELRALRNAEHHVAVSRYIADDEMALAGLDGKDVPVIYNSVDTEWLKPDPAVPEDPGLIVFANSIHPRKGIIELCQGINTVLTADAKARLVVIGKEMIRPKNGRTMTDDLLDSIQPEFRSRVTFTGRLKERSEVYDYLRRAAICCYPSHLEAFGIAPLEAMSLGKAVLYSRTGPGAEVVEDGVSGLLCDPRDPGDIATQLLRLLHDAPLRRKMGLAARERAVRLFDKKPWAEQNLRFYQDCVR